MQTVDTLIEARWVVPVEPAGVVHEHYAVAIDAGRIIAVVPQADGRRDYAPRTQVVLPEHILIPGLINLHTHAAMSLLRGLADDLALMTWLTEHIWPAEGVHVSSEFVHDGTLLACAEMLRSGVTCMNDMYFFPEASARALLTARMRASLGMIAIEFPSAYAANADEYLDKGLAVRDEFRDAALLNFTFAPHAPYTVSDRTFERIATLAGELDLPIHTHVHETLDELAQSDKDHGTRPLARLARLGLVTPSLIAVHAVHLNQTEIELLAANGCHVAHCPASNLKLASGLAPVSALLRAGVNVGIGTDGAASNNRLDMLAEMRLAALLAKGVANDAATVPAAQALAMCTLQAARALALDDRIGSITPGKCADLTAVRMDGLETEPCFDPVSHLVYAAGREQVSHVWVDGELLLDDRHLTRLDQGEIIAKAKAWKHRIQP